MKFIRNAATTLVIALMVTACGSSDPTIAPPGETDTDAEFRGLRVIGNKDEFSQSIRDALINQIGSGGYGVAFGISDELAVPSVSAPAAEADTAADAGASPDVTGTNVQEAGVDEADRIKSDGSHLYVLNRAFQDFGPVAEPGIEIDPAATSIAPFFDPGKSQVRILSLDAEAATSSLVKELELETGNETANGMYLYDADGSKSLIVTSSSLGGYWGYWDTPVQFMGQQSTIHKIDIANPGAAGVADSLKLDGQIVSSRRIGQYMYVASRFFPQVQTDVADDDATALEEAINNADIEDLLPNVTRASDSSVQALADASNCFVAQKPDNGFYSPDIITLAVIDIETMSVTDSKCYLGATETLYASTKAIYLATTQYNYSFGVAETGTAPIPVDSDTDIALVPEFDPRINTDIHQFNISGGQLSYVGSGVVEGHLGWNELQKPFRMSELDGYLRVATYNDTQNASASPVLLSVMAPSDNNQLTVVAKLPNQTYPAPIGKPREQLHASRFLGNKAYLVTFRQIDPLYVIDLSDPLNPVPTGELEIEGYSDYLHPIGEDYLLGIGKGAIADTTNSPDADRGAFAQGVKLSLFDVSDAGNPNEVQAVEIGKRGTHAAALQDHHGITVQAATDSRPARVTFGIDVHETANQFSSGPAGWYNWTNTGLFAFEIQTGNNAGITTHGSIIVESPSAQQPFGPIRGSDRSVIVNDAVFYVHGEQVYGANWNSLGTVDGPR